MAEKTRYQKAINERQDRDKQLLLNILKEMPIAAVACEKSGIGRTSYYRWLKEDKEFVRKSAEAMKEGDHFLNDMAKSQLVSLMKNKYWPTIKYHLERKHPEYRERIDSIVEDESLTPEQEAVVRKALRLVARPNKKNL